MSTTVPPTPSAGEPSNNGSTPTTGAPGGATGSAPAAPTEFRYGESAEVPAWARGKTAAEVLGIANQATSALQDFIQTGRAPQAPPQPQYQPQQPQYQPPAWETQPRNPQNGQWANQIDPDQPLTLAQLQALAPQFVQQSMQPQLSALAQNTANLAFDTVYREESKAFQRYGPEINALLARVPRETWTIDTVRQAVRIVKADHIDDLARERAEQLVNDQFPTLRSNGGAPGTPIAPARAADSIFDESIPEETRDRLRKAGVTEQTAQSFCEANGITMKDYVAMLKKDAITEVRQRMFNSSV